MLAKLAEFLTRYSMSGRLIRIGAAVSGGRDSVALLAALRELGQNVHVVHVNHHLRGAESDLDEEFVRNLAVGLPFHRVDADVRGVPGNLEQAARDARRAFFHKLLDDRTVDVVALAHTRDDQAETVLMRLLRGTGLHGLAAMRPMSEGFIRPLLAVSRKEVEVFAADRKLAWREDSSNVDLGFTRNRIRRVLIPALERDYNPALREGLAQLADTAGAEEDWWNSHIAEPEAVAGTGDGNVLLSVGVLNASHLAVARRQIRRALEMVRGDLRQIEFDHVEAIRSLGLRRQGHGRIALPGIVATRSFGEILLSRIQAEIRPYRFPVVPGGTYRPPGVSLELVEPVDHVKVKADLAWDIAAAALHIRSFEAGDAYQPAGEQRQRKLKDLFQRARIPSWKRAGWPVIESGGRIVWTRQFGPAADVAAAADSKTVLRIRELS